MATTAEIVYACIALFFACALSSAGGIGGGGLNVPIFLIICKFNFDVASSLSLFVVLGNSIAQTLLNYNQPHPLNARQPMIFWAFGCLLLPAQLGGGNIGGSLKEMLSTETLYVLALVVLTFAATISLRKGLAKWAKETDELQKATGRTGTTTQSTLSPLQPSSGFVAATSETIRPSFVRMEVESIDYTNNGNGTNTMVSDFDPSNRATDDEEKTSGGILWPWELLTALLLMWVAQLCLRVVNVTTNRCSSAFWAVFAFIYLPLGLCSLWTLSFLNFKSRHTTKEVNDMSLGGKLAAGCSNIPNLLVSFCCSGDSSLKAAVNNSATSEEANAIDLPRHGWYLVIVVFIIGLIANLLGIGGAELISPLLLVLQALPEVASATSGSMNLLNTTANVLVNLMTLRQKRIDNNDDDEAHHDEQPALFCVLLCVGFLGGLLGRYSGLYVAKKLRRASVIIFALVAGLYLTCLYYLVALAAGGVDDSTKAFCDS